MRASIVALAATTLAVMPLLALAGHAPERQEPNGPGLAFDEDSALRSGEVWRRPARAADEDQPLKPARMPSKASLSADDAELHTGSQPRGKPMHAADDDAKLKPAGAARRDVRNADDEAPTRKR